MFNDPFSIRRYYFCVACNGRLTENAFVGNRKCTHVMRFIWQRAFARHLPHVTHDIYFGAMVGSLRAAVFALAGYTRTNPYLLADVSACDRGFVSHYV